MSVVQTAHENSERFRPAFARLTAPQRERPGVYKPLGLAYRNTSRAITLSPSDDERILARFGVTFQVIGAMNDRGEPPGTTWTGNFFPTAIAEGVGELAVTDRRLVILQILGRSVAGPVKLSQNTVLAMVMPLVDIEYVTLSRGTGFFGGIKEKGVTIACYSQVALIRLESAYELVGDQGTKVAFSRISDVVVHAAAEFRLASTELGEAERDLLERARRGERQEEDGDLVVSLVPEGPGDASGSSGSRVCVENSCELSQVPTELRRCPGCTRQTQERPA
jgi:hypothetical protein